MIHHRKMRAKGTGSIESRGAGFRWLLTRNGDFHYSKVWQTYREAEQELARFVADPTFVPAAKAVQKPRAAPRKKSEPRAPRAAAVVLPVRGGPTDAG